jgi:hypothetical protein
MLQVGALGNINEARIFWAEVSVVSGLAQFTYKIIN